MRPPSRRGLIGLEVAAWPRCSSMMRANVLAADGQIPPDLLRAVCNECADAEARRVGRRALVTCRLRDQPGPGNEGGPHVTGVVTQSSGWRGRIAGVRAQMHLGQ